MILFVNPSDPLYPIPNEQKSFLAFCMWRYLQKEEDRKLIKIEPKGYSAWMIWWNGGANSKEFFTMEEFEDFLLKSLKEKFDKEGSDFSSLKDFARSLSPN